MAGAAVPAGADPGALLDGAALRVAFAAPAPGQVKEFDGVRRHREDGGQFVELVGGGAVVGDGVPQLQQAAVVQCQGGGDGEAGVGIGLDDDGGVALGARCDDAEAGREVEAGDAVGDAVAAEGGAATPAGGSLRQQAGGNGGVGG